MLKVVKVGNDIYSIDENAQKAFLCHRGFLNIDTGQKAGDNWQPKIRIAHVKKGEFLFPLKVKNNGEEKQLTIKTQAVLLQEAIQTI